MANITGAVEDASMSPPHEREKKKKRFTNAHGNVKLMVNRLKTSEWEKINKKENIGD